MSGTDRPGRAPNDSRRGSDGRRTRKRWNGQEPPTAGALARIGLAPHPLGGKEPGAAGASRIGAARTTAVMGLSGGNGATVDTTASNARSGGNGGGSPWPFHDSVRDDHGGPFARDFGPRRDARLMRCNRVVRRRGVRPIGEISRFACLAGGGLGCRRPGVDLRDGIGCSRRRSGAI